MIALIFCSYNKNARRKDNERFRRNSEVINYIAALKLYIGLIVQMIVAVGSIF